MTNANTGSSSLDHPQKTLCIFTRIVRSFSIVCIMLTALSVLGRFHWLLDLFSHFRIQYLALLLIVCVALGIQRQFKLFLACLIAAGIQGVIVAPYLLVRSSPIPNSGLPLHRIMLMNVNTHHGDPTRVDKYIREIDSDVLILEEISDSWMAELKVIVEKYPYSFSQPRSDNFGIGVFSKFPLENTRVIEASEDIPTISTHVIFASTPIHLIATHPLPPIGSANSMKRNHQLASLPNYLSEDIPNILIGDLNTTPWNHHFQRLASKGKLNDSCVGRGWQPTWPSQNFLLRIPLDHFLYSDGIQVRNRFVGDHVGSDHFPLIVDFEILK